MPGPAYRDFLRAVGAPEDPVATDTSSSWSFVSLLKAIYGKINDGTLAAGIVSAGDSAIRMAAAGATAQAQRFAKQAKASQVAAAASAVVASTADASIAFCQGAVTQALHYMKLARASKVAAAASAVLTAADAVATAADVVTTNANAGVATEASNRSAGYALIGQRAHKDRVAAAASAAAAAASAASITSEGLVLGVQVFS